MTAESRKIPTMYDKDWVRVEGSECSPIVFVDVKAGVDRRKRVSVHMSPEQAIEFAKALKKAARKAGG